MRDDNADKFRDGTGVIYYAVFRFVILKFDLKTPGRAEYQDTAEISSIKGNDTDFVKMAAIILEGLGGKGNIKELDHCATRIRTAINDYTLVDENAIKKAGIAGVIRPDKSTVQVIIGTKVQFVYEEMKRLL